MTVKTRGIRLKEHLSPEDQGQRKLMQVTYSQVAALRPAAVADRAAVRRHIDPNQPRPSTPAAKRGVSSNARRRAIARMLRIELEATLEVLDQALDRVAENETQVK